MYRTRVLLARALRGCAGVVGTLLSGDRSMETQLGTPSRSSRVVGGLEGAATRLEPASSSLLNHGGPEPLHRQAGRAAVVGTVTAYAGARAAGRKARAVGGRVASGLANRLGAVFGGAESDDDGIEANLA